MGADNLRIEDLRRRVQADPASIAFAQLAEECRRAGEHEEAIRVCRNGLARYPGYHSARVTLARALLSLNRVDEARSEFDVVLQSSPDNLAAARGLDEIRELRGELPAARTAASSSVVTKSHAAEVLFDLDALLEQLDERSRRVAESPPLPIPEELPTPTEMSLESLEARGPAPIAEPRDKRSIEELESWLGAIVAERRRSGA